MARKKVKTRSYEEVWLARRKALPNESAYLQVGTKLAGYDQLGKVLVRYILCHGNFAYILCRRKGVEATKDLVISRRSFKTQRMGMAGVIQMRLYEDFVALHQNKLLRDALWRAQSGEVVLDPRLDADTLAMIADDFGVSDHDLQSAIYRAQDGELVYDQRLSPETLAALAHDLRVSLPPLDAELAAHATDMTEPEV